MIPLFLVGQYDNRRKRALMEYLWERGALDAAHAIALSGTGTSPSVLKSLVSRKVVIRTPADRYYLDESRVNDAWGASNKFILYALGATVVAILVIMLL